MDFQPLKDFLDYYLPMLGVPGSDTVIYKGHKEIFRHTSGFDSLENQTMLTPDKMYNIYSCTKIATSVAILQLIERGELLASDPVYAYIPEFKDIKVKVRDAYGNVIGTRAPVRPMLISHLLTMTSGISYDLNMRPIREVIENTAGRAPTVDICRAIASEPLECDPGERYIYSLSCDVLAGIVEIVSGVRFADYMNENVFLPLGMKETSYHIDFANKERFAAHYRYDEQTRSGVEIPFEENAFRFGTEYDSGGAGIVSTVDDYILLIDALANGGVAKNGNRILSSRSIDLMRTNALNDSQLSEFATKQCDGYGYGYGVRVNMNPSRASNLASVGSFGWDGWKLCLAIADPENNLAVFHAEHMGGLHSIIIPRLRNVIYACLRD